MALFFYILFSYFAASTLYVLVLSLAGVFNKRQTWIPASHQRTIVILVPAYQEDAVIDSSTKALLALDYPNHLFEVVVIADSLKKSTLSSLRGSGATVVEVSFKKSTKAKALNQAMASLGDAYDIAIISDADNILAQDFLTLVNQAFSNGATVIQGRRVAKNRDTSVALLDTYSEEVNNHLFRKGANVLGLSSALIGSGMAFRYSDLKAAMADIHAVGGFDRVLQLKLIELGHKITYLEEALVYDEKVADTSSYENQRRRWYASQIKYLNKYFAKGVVMLFRGNISYFNLSVLGSLFLSRVINLGALGTIAILVLLSGVPVNMIVAWWMLFFLYLLAILIPLRTVTYKSQLFGAIFILPKLFYITLRTLLKFKGADQKFLHTSHRLIENNAFNHEKK